MQPKQNYDQKAQNQQNQIQRRNSKTYEVKAFNNWIKSVLINLYTEQMTQKLERQLDLHRGHKNSKVLHVLDIGCGRGQDIKKWSHARVSYMVATDFSQQCIKKYQERWQNQGCPYKLYTTVCDFTSPNLYGQIEHSYYDIVSSQFSFHYMFNDQKKLKQGLANILSNLLIDGLFIATIPDSYTILKMIKQKGKKTPDGKYVYGNKYFSFCFNQIDFDKPYGNQYGFYLEESVGNKKEDGTIEYTKQWLISLDHLEQILKLHGVHIEQTMNFLQFYQKHRDKYKYLFSRFKLSYEYGEQMEDQLWEIVHLYRVLICKKHAKGKPIHQFNLNERIKSIKQVHQKQYEESRQQMKPQYRRYDNQRGRGDQRRNNYQGNSSQSNNRKFYDKKN